MPYRIYAKNTRTGQRIVRMDLQTQNRDVTDRNTAQALADTFAETRGHGGEWIGEIEHYTTTDTNPNWDWRRGGKIR